MRPDLGLIGAGRRYAPPITQAARLSPIRDERPEKHSQTANANDQEYSVDLAQSG